MLPPFGNDQIIGAIEKPIPHIFDIHLIGDIGKHRHTRLGEHHHAAGAGAFMTPAIFPFRIEVESVSGMLHRRHFVAGPDQLRNHALDQRGFSAVRATDKTENGYGHK